MTIFGHCYYFDVLGNLCHFSRVLLHWPLLYGMAAVGRKMLEMNAEDESSRSSRMTIVDGLQLQLQLMLAGS